MSEREGKMEGSVISEGDVIESVHISPIGDFSGSDQDGNPVPERIDRQSLERLAEKLNDGDEILFDADHASVRPGDDRNTRAAGWFSRFFVDPARGLFARLKLTRWGKELVSGREYRYVSPTFGLDAEGKPVELYSVAATNTPAFAGAISPILNQSPSVSEGEDGMISVSTEKEEKDISEMDIDKLKEELRKEILETLREEIAKNACDGNDDEIIANSEDVVEEKREETVEDPVEEKKEEVVAIETLNSAPKPELRADPFWAKLSGSDFIRAFESGKIFRD